MTDTIPSPRLRRWRLRALLALTAVAIIGQAEPGRAQTLPGRALVASDVAPLPASVRSTRATDSSRPWQISLVLPSRDPAGLASFVASVTDPKSKLYRQWLTEAEFAQRFGANPADYDALVAWARSNGLSVGETFDARTVLKLQGPASAIAAAFGVTFQDYVDAQNRAFTAATQAPSLPANLAGKVQSALGFRGDPVFHPLVRPLTTSVLVKKWGHGPTGGYNAQDLRTLYDLPPQVSPKATQTVAVFEQGGFYPSDVQQYLQTNNLAAVPVVDRNVDGYSGAVDDPNVDLEATLDIDMVVATNPQVGRVVVYEDGNVPFSTALVDSLEAIAADNRAQTVSISYGLDEALTGMAAAAAENTVLQQLAAQGQQVFVSSGDRGAYGDLTSSLNVEDPGSQPLVTSVGGTRLVPANGGYGGETAWNEFHRGPRGIDPLGYGASGGGVSQFWPLPFYQSIDQFYLLDHRFSTSNRNVPDVAAVGDEFTGVDVYAGLFNGWVRVGGTSVASPIWAGTFAIANADSENYGFGRIGYLNNTLYFIGDQQYTAFFPNLAYGAQNTGVFDFHDITKGSNSAPASLASLGLPRGFSTNALYDNVTGFGSMNGGGLAIDLALFPITRHYYETSLAVDVPKLQVQKRSITATWKPVAGAQGYYASLLTYNPGSSSSPVVYTARLSTTPNVTFDNLSPNTFYVVFAFAFDGNGYNWSPFPAIGKTLP